MPKNQRSAYLQALEFDNSFPIEQAAVDLWLKDLDNPFRWSLRPLLQCVLAIVLHLVWFFKRLPLPQFSAHNTLQRLICWFCKYFVSYEANLLILRHYATESNLLNFLATNANPDPDPDPHSQTSGTALVNLYPKKIDDMLEDSFVKHDQELFRLFKDLGHWRRPSSVKPPQHMNWQAWQPVEMQALQVQRKKTQVVDFESAHALFMCLFCLLLTREEYRDAINGFNLDQSIAIRLGELTGKAQFSEMAYNKFPLYLVGPWNLGQRFLMHGFFTEYLYAALSKLHAEAKNEECTPVAFDI